jgi:hypothetical protein
MTARATAPDRAYDPIRFHRGTRGFAAFVTIINGFAMLAVGALVVPAAGLPDTLAKWLATIGIAAGIAHFVGVYGLIRGRAWSGQLVAYLAAGGIGASVFAILLITRAGESVMGAGDASAVGYFVWMIGSWAIAARFALKPFRAPARVRSTRAVASPVAQGLAPWVSPRPLSVGAAA